jgi:hypothetical protein
MTQQKTPIELTSFSKGFVTEVNPLTFPPDASVDELNFTINRNGTRSRRLGMDYETNYELVQTKVDFSDKDILDSGVYRWENVGDNPNITVAVIWFGNFLSFHDLTQEEISPNLQTNSVTLSRFDKNSKFSFASVDGRLVVAAGADEVAVLTYNVTNMKVEYQRLLIRDLFGVEDLYNNSDTDFETIDLREGNNVQFRPQFKTDAHVYNLRNQSWGNVKRSHLESSQSFDPIENFHTAANYKNDKYKAILPVEGPNKGTSTDKGVLPSNSDITHYGMAPDAQDDPPSDNFYARTLFDDPIGNVEAPRGYFVIDALSRGTSRLQAYKELMERNPRTDSTRGLSVDIDNLPSDITPGGASQVAEFAGRVWYAGFSGEIIDGDSYSPKLSSYLLFSKLVESASDINKCFQEGDPTSEETPDIVDSDGGYLRISGAYGIKKLINVGSALVVLAQNGVWVVFGDTLDSGFSATSYQVSKISDYSVASSKSVVEIDNGLMYWSNDGIYVLSRNDLGSYSVDNITQNTIQTFYDSIPQTDKEKASGIFDQYERKVRWLYGENKELIFDVKNGAFTKNEVAVNGQYLKSHVETTSFSVGVLSEDLVVDDVPVVVNGEEVTVNSRIRNSGTRSIKYLTISSYLDASLRLKIQYTFSLYKDQSFRDWKSVDGEGVDANAYIITGYLSGGDTQRAKQVPYLTVHLLQTESGFDSDFELLNQSSCKIQAQWDWTNNVNSNRWGKEFQGYRMKRVYLSDDFNFNNGHLLVTTKNKLRGKGKVVSLLFKTEPDKDCQLLGWSMVVGTKQNV